MVLDFRMPICVGEEFRMEFGRFGRNLIDVSEFQKNA